MRTSSPLILVVEDNASLREVLESMLSAFGFETHLAATVEEALCELEQSVRVFDCILIDYNLGMQTTAFDVISHIQELGIRAAVIVMTDGLEAEVIIRNAEIKFISKPFTPVGLIAVIRGE